jgi:hypothetical protein
MDLLLEAEAVDEGPGLDRFGHCPGKRHILDPAYGSRSGVL